jgi:hypothetical protein
MEYRMKKVLLFVCLVTFSLLPQKETTKDHTKYFPLNVGNKWEYEWEHNGTVISSTIINISNKDANKKYVLEKEVYMSNMGLSVNTEERYTIRNQMILNTGFGGGLFGQDYTPFMSCPIILKLPLKVGSAWEYQEDGGRKKSLRF